MDNANGLAEICEKCDEQKNSKLAEMHNVYLAAQFQIQIPDVAINLYHFTSYYCVGSIMYDFFNKNE